MDFFVYYVRFVLGFIETPLKLNDYLTTPLLGGIKLDTLF